MYSIRSWAAAALLLKVVAGLKIRPFTDAHCTKPVKDMTYDNGPLATDYFDNAPGWGTNNFITNPVFPGASKDSKPGYEMYWEVDDLDDGCGVALMEEYSQSSYGRLPITIPPGNVILITDSPGCYYSFISQETELSTNFCCGTDDCSGLSPGYAAISKRELGGQSLSKKSEVELPKPHTRKRGAMAQLSPVKPSNLIARDDSSFDSSTCKVEIQGDGTNEAGKQSLVADVNTCDQGSCGFDVSNGITVSTTYSTSSTSTLTDTQGKSVSAKKGINFLVLSNEHDNTWSKSIAESTAKMTGTSITASTDVRVTNHLGQKLGTTAFVTFTPTYKCWSTKVTCAEDTVADFDFCQPQMNEDKSTIQGDYTVVYTG